MSAQHTPGPEYKTAPERMREQNAELLAIAHRLALATNEGEDQAQGTHYIDKQGVIRCKGSFLALIDDARSAIAKATGRAA